MLDYVKPIYIMWFALFDMRLLRNQSKNIASDASKERRTYHSTKPKCVEKLAWINTAERQRDYEANVGLLPSRVFFLLITEISNQET